MVSIVVSILFHRIYYLVLNLALLTTFSIQTRHNAGKAVKVHALFQLKMLTDK